jgi:hypothetical protein
LLGQEWHSEQNNRPKKSERNPNDRKVRPQVVKAVVPRAVVPRAAKVRAAKVRVVEPKVVAPRVEHKVVEPRVDSGCRVCRLSKLWMLIKMAKFRQKKLPMPWPL